MRALPKTFQDAVLLTRALGVRYLWIDSLCIIQDDEKDWKRENPKMGEVYQYATITIAAAHARDSSEGCFYEEPCVTFVPNSKPEEQASAETWRPENVQNERIGIRE